MKKLVFATHNKHKLLEIQNIIGNHFKLLSLDDIGCSEDIPEESPTLEGNASAKAWYVYNKFKMNCFADDTGLEIDALEGRPGVKSARYAGADCNAENNIQKVLTELDGITRREARFRTVISLIIDRNEIFFEGTVKGSILQQKRGLDGFGYDPIFLSDGFTESFAEMSLEQKNIISHRSRAMQKLMEYLSHLQ